MVTGFGMPRAASLAFCSVAKGIPRAPLPRSLPAGETKRSAARTPVVAAAKAKGASRRVSNNAGCLVVLSFPSQVSTGTRGDEIHDRLRVFRRKRKMPLALPDDNRDL